MWYWSRAECIRVGQRGVKESQKEFGFNYKDMISSPTLRGSPCWHNEEVKECLYGKKKTLPQVNVNARLVTQLHLCCNPELPSSKTFQLMLHEKLKHMTSVLQIKRTLKEINHILWSSVMQSHPLGDSAMPAVTTGRCNNSWLVATCLIFHWISGFIVLCITGSRIAAQPCGDWNM